MRMRTLFLVSVLCSARHAFAVDYAANYTVLGVVPGFCPGEQKTLTIKVTNTGALSWDTSAYHLSYHLAQGANVITFDGVRTVLPAPVSPGGSVTLSAQVKIPAGNGAYTVQLDMVRENVTWFSSAGNPTKNVDVTVAFTVACASAPSLSRPDPVIDGCFPGTKPGLFVVCWGKNFGQSRGGLGRIWLKGLNNPVDLSTGSNLKWNDKSFFADVPSKLGGFRKGQVVRAQLVTSQGKTSNEWTLTIDPVYDVVSVATGVLATCGGNHGDHCTGLNNPNTGFWYYADHSNSGAFPSGDAGTDVWKFKLINDYVTDHIDFYDYHPGRAKLSGFSPGVSQFTITVAWSYDWAVTYTYETYNFNVWAIGPRGVPYQ